jgi:hypothetical protein
MKDKESGAYRTHADLTEMAAGKMGLNMDLVGYLVNYSRVPDTWSIFQMPLHYMPFAAVVATQCTREARRQIDILHNFRNGLQLLSLGMHFMADCGCPWHHRLFSFAAQRYHLAYERFVSDNMDKGHCFREFLLETPDHNFFPEFRDDLCRGALYIGVVADQAFDYLYHAIRNHPGWEEDAGVAAITRTLLENSLRMCETQIEHVKDTLYAAFPLPGSVEEFREQPRALTFYRLNAGRHYREWRGRLPE